MAGGMAGGSADAAGALLACDHLWGLGLPRDDLLEMAAELGSDIPFVLTGGIAVGSGRGERLAPVARPGQLPLGPRRQRQGPVHPGGVCRVRPAARQLPRSRTRSRPTEMMTALRSGDADALGAALTNDLSDAAISLLPDLGEVLVAGLEYGAIGGVVSGSGPTVAFLTDSPEAALDLCVSLAAVGRRRRGPSRQGPGPRSAGRARPDRARLTRRPRRIPEPGWPTSSPSRPRPSSTARPRSSTPSRPASGPASGSGSSAATAAASRRCCGSWPASSRSTPAGPPARAGRRSGLLSQVDTLDPAWTVREAVVGDPARARLGRRRAGPRRADRPARRGRRPVGRRPRRRRRSPLRRRASPAGAGAAPRRRPRPPAPRRAHQPPRRRGRRLARRPPGDPAHPPGRGLVVGHARPVVPRRGRHADVGGDRRRRSRPTRAGMRRTSWPAPSATGSRPCSRSAARTCCARSWPGCGGVRRPAPASPGSASTRPTRSSRTSRRRATTSRWSGSRPGGWARTSSTSSTRRCTSATGSSSTT